MKESVQKMARVLEPGRPGFHAPPPPGSSVPRTGLRASEPARSVSEVTRSGHEIQYTGSVQITLSRTRRLIEEVLSSWPSLSVQTATVLFLLSSFSRHLQGNPPLPGEKQRVGKLSPPLGKNVCLQEFSFCIFLFWSILFSKNRAV